MTVHGSSLSFLQLLVLRLEELWRSSAESIACVSGGSASAFFAATGNSRQEGDAVDWFRHRTF